ncbi:YdaS family helix-turn-helix protein [Sphingomonas sp. BK235]|uniref:transcriptional regulator n=1 Tax=Sphingomonas sp. BK235 TaxID=2512131 RepID=UPI00104FB8A9|nr:YdaS family helix-turn-helix protein [Sphingomonas sp. BK235]
MDDATPQEALREAVERAGGQSATARLVGVSQTAVWKWITEAKVLPAEHVLAVERATGVSRHLLRPDIYPLEEVGRVNGAPQ